MVWSTSFLNKYFTNEASKLFNILLDQFFLSLSTLLTTIVLARSFSMADYAEIILLFSISLFVLGFQSAVISKPYAINLNDFFGKEQAEYRQFNMFFKLLYTLLVLLIFPLLYFLLFDSFNFNSMVFYMLYVISYTGYYFVRETLLGERKTKINLYYGLACAVGLIVLLLCIWALKVTDIFYFLGFASLIYLLATTIYFIRHFRSLKASIGYLNKYFEKNWDLGKWLLGSNLLFHLSTNIYPWLLLYLASKNDVAVFGVLLSVAALVNPLMTAMNSYLLPVFAKASTDAKDVDKKVRKSIFVLAILSSLLVLTGYFYGQEIIALLFGNKYAGLGLLVLYPFIVQAINILFQPLKISLNAIKRTDINFWLLVPRSIIAVGLGYFLVDRYGISGAFYTMIIETTLYNIIQYGVYQKVMNKKRIIDARLQDR